MKKIGLKTALLLMSILLLFNNLNYVSAASATDIRLVVNGKDITELSAPFIENDRTLVPVRFIAEELGAVVTWDGTERTVLIKREDISIFLRTDSFLVMYDNGESYNISDVAPKIINDRTYVPLRLISNAFGIGIEWDGESRTVIIDSGKNSDVMSFYDVHISSHIPGDTITEKTQIEITAAANLSESADEIKILLLDGYSASGFIVSKGDATDTSFVYNPKTEDNGSKVLVAALYDEKGNFMGGDAIPVNINIKPEISISGIERQQMIKDTVTIEPLINFQPSYIDYEIKNTHSGYIKVITGQDPEGSYKWTPVREQNGITSIKIIAYDNSGKAYESTPLPVIVYVNRKLSVTGISENMTIKKPVTLYASRNYDVDETQFFMRDTSNGRITILATIPYGGFKWFPGPDDAGEKEIFTRVKDTKGIRHQSSSVKVTVDSIPRVIMTGVGPNQVLSSSANLSVISNVELDSIKYFLNNKTTGEKRYLNTNTDPSLDFKYNPESSDAGKVSLFAECIYEGVMIKSETVNFSIYTDPLYGPAPITGKSDFLDFASNLSVDSLEKTGMSAALQTAQAILETGWGQSIPVDKYEGTFSNNLFGIKGTGSNGSVVSNTWEVFNGISYRVDANFRAYNNVNEGWDDHKGFLLALSRYKSFRKVMHDSTTGAWALWRAGYATDPKYSIKLIRIINQYNLVELDRTSL